jgi:predicted metalloprotease with PDZ domain
MMVLMCLLSVLGGSATAQTPAASTVSYRATFPEPEHHWLEVEATFRDLGDAPLRARMSRSSPGRYAVHEFSKNVFSFQAFDSTGRRLTATRPDVDEWRVSGHDGTVRVVYRIFGDHADGTYMAVDTTHAHLNIPATFLWAVGLESRPIEIRLVPPPDSGWTAGTQLFPTTDPFTFTAPNLQYFMDSPVELARLLESHVTVADGDRTVRLRLLAHTTGRQSDLDALAGMVAAVAEQGRRVFGTFPTFEPGYYTFLLDYVPWVDDDAMEHRNSTYVSDSSVSIATEAGRRAALDAISHEFFHVWNVERIRPVGLEPFDFTRENITCCLWLAEGFTEYYGPLLLTRAGFRPMIPFGPVTTSMTHPGRLIRSAVEMSEHGPFADAGVANDVDDRSRTFISYYTHGSAIALALDLSIRERTNGRVSLDDFMRRLWATYGAPAPAAPGLVARPYSLADLRRELGALVNDAPFANDFFDRYIEGRDVPDYARLLGLAGFTVRPIAPARGWIGAFRLQEDAGGLLVGGWANSGSVVPFGTPAYDAGLDRGDLIVAIDGRAATTSAWASIGQRSPGERVALTVRRRDGSEKTMTVTLAADPAVAIVSIPSASLGAAARTFRAAWLGN